MEQKIIYADSDARLHTDPELPRLRRCPPRSWMQLLPAERLRPCYYSKCHFKRFKSRLNIQIFYWTIQEPNLNLSLWWFLGSNIRQLRWCNRLGQWNSADNLISQNYRSRATLVRNDRQQALNFLAELRYASTSGWRVHRGSTDPNLSWLW